MIIESPVARMEEDAQSGGWLHTFSRTALGLINKTKATVEKRRFKIPISVHKLIELEVLEYYSRRTREVWFCPVGNFKAFDGISQSHLHSVEVKFESMAASSLNLCIEYEYKGRPSGIMATKAEKWVHIVPVDQNRLCCYEFDTVLLRNRLGNFPLYPGGDGKKSRFKLFPIAEAEKLVTAKFFLRIDWNVLRPYWGMS
jgi:hypothetical protein